MHHDAHYVILDADRRLVDLCTREPVDLSVTIDLANDTVSMCELCATAEDIDPKLIFGDAIDTIRDVLGLQA